MRTKKIICLFLIMSILGFPTVYSASSDVQALSNGFKKVAVGSRYSIGVRVDGSLWQLSGYNRQTRYEDGCIIYDSSPVMLMDSVKSVTAAGTQYFAIKNDGSLFGWGFNSYGQLGDGTKNEKSSPEKIMEGVKDVAAGKSYSIILKEDGSLLGCGDNNQNQLGIGCDIKVQYSPVKIMDGVKSISTSEPRSSVVKEDGSLWIWGGSDMRYNPVKIMDGVKEASMGGSYSLALKDDGSLLRFENDPEYQKCEKIMDGVKKIKANNLNYIAIKEDNSLWMWGRNCYGEVGDGTNFDRNTPVKVMDDVMEVSMGDWYNMAVKRDGSLWAWGLNDDNQFGASSRIVMTRQKPYKIMDGVMKIKVEGNKSYAISKDGGLWKWGSYENSLPERISENVKEVLTSWNSGGTDKYYNLIIKGDNSLWALGYNEYGQLGDGTFENRDVPVKIMEDVKNAYAYKNQNYAIKQDGSLLGWGHGLVGNAPGALMDKVTAFDGGYALKEDGSLWAWGESWRAALGDYTYREKGGPVKIMCDVKYYKNNMAIKEDGTLWLLYTYSGGKLSYIPVKIMDNVKSFKYEKGIKLIIKNDNSLWVVGAHNDYFDSKEPSSIESLVPEKITDNVKSVFIRDNYIQIIKQDDTLWALGGNDSYQLGDGTDVKRNFPVKITDNIESVGDYTALKKDGSLWQWGRYTEFHGPAYNYRGPEKIMDGIKAISVGEHCLALDTNGGLWAWGGSNHAGQLGDGSLVFSSVPVEIYDSKGDVISHEPAAMPNAFAPKECKLYGYVKPDFTGSSGENFKIEVEGDIVQTVTDKNGYFELYAVSPASGLYTLKISKNGYLTRSIKGIDALPDMEICSELNPLNIWAGDIGDIKSQDGAINMKDILAIANAFNTRQGDRKYSVECDYNNDGAVNMLDILLVAKYFNKSSADYDRGDVVYQ